MFESDLSPESVARITIWMNKQLRAAIAVSKARTPSDARTALLEAADILSEGPETHQQELIRGLRSGARDANDAESLKLCREVAQSFTKDVNAMQMTLREMGIGDQFQKRPWWKFW